MNRLYKLLISFFLISSLILSSCSIRKDGDEDTSSKSRLNQVDSSKSETSEKTINTESITTEIVSINTTDTEILIEENTVSAPEVEPDVYFVQSICELATLQCYFHNVAKMEKEPGSGLSHLGEDPTPFWFEYTAQATLGIDGSQVTMAIDGNNITVYIPHATILGNISVDPTSVSEPIYPPSHWYTNDVEITASDVTDSMGEANDMIVDQILSDSSLISSAEYRAKDLITNYIDQIMELSDIEYSITFIFIEEE